MPYREQWQEYKKRGRNDWSAHAVSILVIVIGLLVVGTYFAPVGFYCYLSMAVVAALSMQWLYIAAHLRPECLRQQKNTDKANFVKWQ